MNGEAAAEMRYTRLFNTFAWDESTKYLSIRNTLKQNNTISLVMFNIHIAISCKHTALNLCTTLKPLVMRNLLQIAVLW